MDMYSCCFRCNVDALCMRHGTDGTEVQRHLDGSPIDRISTCGKKPSFAFYGYSTEKIPQTNHGGVIERNSTDQITSSPTNLKRMHRSGVDTRAATRQITP